MDAPEEDINALIRKLNEEGRSAATLDAGRLDAWLGALAERAGSDLLLVAGAPPAVRVDGRVLPLPEATLSGEEIEEAVLPALVPPMRSRYAREGIGDASYRVAGLGRFRLNLHRERGRAAAAVRALPAEPPRMASLGLPAGVVPDQGQVCEL